MLAKILRALGGSLSHRTVEALIKILLIDDYDVGRKARYGPDQRRVHFPHLCIYKIHGSKSATYYRRYISQDVAHDTEQAVEKWLLRHMKDEENLMIDQVDLA
jgi:hypothetical protein